MSLGARPKINLFHVGSTQLCVRVNEHMQGPRFRHMSKFRRWRWDKKPADCIYAQLEVIFPQELMEIFARLGGDFLAKVRRSRVGPSSGVS
jgi:hypothetical protein